MSAPLHGGGPLRLAAALGLLLAGCSVGPRYSPPGDPAPAAFKEAGGPGAPPGSWQPAQPQDAALKGDWWTLFGDGELDQLEGRLAIDNQNVAHSFQNFMAAREQVREAQAGNYPTLAVSPSVTRTHIGTTALGASSSSAGGAAGGGGASGGHAVNATSYSLMFSASWEPDLWGRVADAIRQAQYAAQVSAADLINERLSEQAALASYYFALRGQDDLQAVADRLVVADAKALELTRALSETGIDNEEAVASALAALRSAEQAAIGIAANRALYEHAIATLIGQPASSVSLPVRRLGTTVPAIPIGIPSQLLQRRPDIAAAERTLAEANAAIGIQVSAYYPTLSLTGTAGLESQALSTLFALPALVWSLGASASEVLFDAGLRQATVAQYQALYQADVAAYRQTVLTAFQQVEDALATLRVLSQQVAKQAEAVAAAQRVVDIALARYETGLDPYLDVTTSQIALLNDEQTLVTLRVNQLTAAVQLIQALGGGWDAGALPTPDQLTSGSAVDAVSATPGR
jgi:NodT family efflux transporter outer membrane factor (OMF) lipoprotein